MQNDKNGYWQLKEKNMGYLLPARKRGVPIRLEASSQKPNF